MLLLPILKFLVCNISQHSAISTIYFYNTPSSPYQIILSKPFKCLFIHPYTHKIPYPSLRTVPTNDMYTATFDFHPYCVGLRLKYVFKVSVRVQCCGVVMDAVDTSAPSASSREY